MTSQSSANHHDGPGRKLRVALLFGGQSAEHDVSLRSAKTVIDALDPEKYEAFLIGISREGDWIAAGDPMAKLTAASPMFAIADGSGPVPDDSPVVSDGIPADLGQGFDVVFPVLHGPMGEDGTVQGLFELSGVPYVGSGVLGSSLAMDKGMAKIVLEKQGLPQVPWLLVARRDWLQSPDSVSNRISETLDYPVFSKPANMGSSVGVRKVHGPEGLAPALDEASRYDRRIVVEQGIDARELEVSVLGNDDPIASVVGEIDSGNEFYDYDAKYIDDSSDLIIPANIPSEVSDRARALAVRAFQTLDLAGLARVDFLLDRNSMELYLNEVNTIPGFTSISMYPMLWEASGLSIRDLVDRLIELAIERAQDGETATHIRHAVSNPQSV